MFRSLKVRAKPDKDLPARAHELTMLTRVLEGRLYDDLGYDFHTERNPAGEYIPIRERRPSVRYALCKTVVRDSVALLFSDGHFPTIQCKNEETQAALTRIVTDCALNAVLVDAATRGSVGSVAIWLRVLDNRLYFNALPTMFLTPEWKPTAPDMLDKVTEKYKTTGQALRDNGYTISDDDLSRDFWFQRIWDANAETWYQPWPVDGKTDVQPSIDAQRTVEHKLGFVPLVWIKNLPGGDDIDGVCSFADAIDTSIEIDYLLSQGARGLKYSADPTLLIKEPAVGNGSGEMIKGAGNAIQVSPEGDAKLLEINGTGASTIIDYVKFLRQLAVESISGNRSDADKLSTAQSGRAMELMNQALIWLADQLRISYGQGAFLELLRMIVVVSAKFQLQHRDGSPVGQLGGSKEPITLRWPDFYPPTNEDLVQKANGLKTMVDGGIISRKTAVASASVDFDVKDPAEELALVEKDLKARDEAAQKKVQVNE